MEKYNKVTPEIAAELQKIIGERYVIFGEPEKMEMYAHDEIADKGYAHMPDVVVKPRTAVEISEIMKLANRESIPVTPRGAGSGLSGGAVPVYGGIVLSVERMNQILEIDKENLTMTLEPGVITNDVNGLLKDYGLFYAGYPMSLETCYIGGNVAENAGGGKAVKYGVTGRYLMGLEVVLPTGEIIRLGGKRVKDVTGYDLMSLLVGSEGTLGIFTEITIRLSPLPKHSVDLLVLFPDVETAISMVPKIMSHGGIIPTAIEFMDKRSVQASCSYLNEHFAYEDAGAMLLIEVDGNSEHQVEHEYEIIGELCLENGAIEVYVADNATTQERVWRIRRNIAEAFKIISPVQSLEDIVVPFAQIPDLMEKVKKIEKRYGLVIPSYGHAGDGNLHSTPVKPVEMSMEEWDAVLPNVLHDLFQAAAELGGTISGEHGIGSKRKKYMKMVIDPAAIELMKRIKTAFDPADILNPGKVFPDA